MTDAGPRGPVRIFVTGFRLSIGELCDGLARQPEMELVGAAGQIDEAARSLRSGEVDVVLHAVAEGALPFADVSEIRDHTRVPIILLAEQADPALLEEALEADVADVILLPEPAERVAFTIRKASLSTSRLASGERTIARVITVFSPKGGTGKTVVSSNLATSIAKHDSLKTLLLDLDLQFGDAAIMLGIEPEQTLHDLVTAPGELDAAKFRSYLTKHPASGADILAAPLRPEDGELVTDEKVERLLDVARPSYDVIVVDTSPFFHGPMLSTLDHTDELLLVCSPEVPTLKNVRLGIETLKLLAFPPDRMKLVLNRADAGVGMRKPEVEGALGVNVQFELPSVQGVPLAVNRGTPLSLSEPAAEFSRGVRAMSHVLLGRNGSHPMDDPEAVVEAPRRDFASTVHRLTVGWLPGRGSKPDPAEKVA